MKRLVKAILLSALSVSLFSACAGNAVTTTQNERQETNAKVFKIGGTGPLTGSTATYGMAVKQAAEIAVEEINALGGLQFELNFQDDENDAEKAVSAYNALKDWKMQVFLSSVTSTPAVATSAEAASDRFFGLTPSASSTAVTEGNDNIFQMCFTDPNLGSASAQYIHDKNLGSKIAVIYKNDDVYSKGIYETFEDKAKELGLNIVSATTFTEDSQTDFSVQIADAKSKEADFIFLPIYYTPASLILKQTDSIGYKPTVFGVDGMDGILALKGFDKSLAEGVMLLTPFSADSKDSRTVNFVTKYKEKYGEIPNQFAAGAYDCVYAVYEAINYSNGAITPETSHKDICEKLISIFTGDFKFDGVTGTGMTWDKSGEVTKDAKAVVIKSGVYVGIE